MRKTILCLAAMIFAFSVSAQSTNSPDSLKIKRTDTDSLLISISERLDEIAFGVLEKDRYKMYQTENIYNLLKLDTATGKIDQVQWSLDDKEGIFTLNSTALNLFDTGSGTFELYPTKNMYQFILLDKTTGRTWHVQWGTESRKRWIQRIY